MTVHGFSAGSVLALAGTLTLDVALGEPPRRFHPVALFGTLVAVVARDWRHPRAVGVLVAVLFPAAFAAVAGLAVGLVGVVHAFGAVLGAALVLFVTTSLRRLVVTGRRVASLTVEDVDTARTELRALAGRDAAALTPGQVRSATVESLAENLADGLVAPLAGFVLAGTTVTLAGFGPVAALAVGACGAAWMKGVNTLDSMLGYRDRPVGWASARLDDAVMWLPARLSAGLLAAVAGDPGALRSARRWLAPVPSPNAGWPMGTLAATLDVRLEKPDTYTLNPTASLPTPGDASRAVRLVTAAGLLTYLVAAVAVGVVAWR
ncbi:MAG: CobD/CbiB family cobalamin biosynthesis protein [Halovenus sp.]